MATARRAARAFSAPSPGRRRRQPLHAPKGVVEGGQFIGRDALLHAVVQMLAGKPPAAGTPEHRAVSEHLAAKPRRRLLATARQRGLTPRRGKPDADVIAAMMRPAPKPVEAPRAPDNPDELGRLPVARLRAIAPKYGLSPAQARTMSRRELLATLRERATPAPAVDPDEARAQQLLGSWQTFGTLHGLDQLGILSRERPEVLSRIAQARGVQPDEGGNLVWPLSRDASLGRSGAIRAHGDIPPELASSSSKPAQSTTPARRGAVQRMRGPANAAEARQRLLAATSQSEAYDYLNGLGLNVTNSRRLAADLGVRGAGRMPPVEVHNRIVQSLVESRGVPVKPVAPIRPAGAHRAADASALTDLARATERASVKPPVRPPVPIGAQPTDRTTGRRPSAGLRISLALQKWSNGDGPDEPLVGVFTREQLRREALARGVTLRRNATEQQIAAALKDETRQAFRTRAQGRPGLRSPTELMSHTSSDEDIRAVFEGNFGGMTTKVSDIVRGGPAGGLIVEGTVHDSSGRTVGQFVRRYESNRGGVSAHHELLSITSQVQGSGFSNAFNGHLIRWYRQNGVKEVRVHADIDVGGYAWARLGYDFANERTASQIINRLEETVNRIHGNDSARFRLGHNPVAQIRAARELIARARQYQFGDVRYPTPHEISQLGRWDGAGTTMDKWIGKIALLNSNWYGVLRL